MISSTSEKKAARPREDLDRDLDHNFIELSFRFIFILADSSLENHGLFPIVILGDTKNVSGVCLLKVERGGSHVLVFMVNLAQIQI